MKRKLKFNLEENNLVWGDCKDWLPHIPDNSIDLIYIDPPFFSQKNPGIIWGNCFEKISYEDMHKGEMSHYIAWMEERLIIAKRKLKNTGLIFLHCDYRANYRLRSLLDNIFDEDHFVNEIIWDYKKVSNSDANKLLTQHQTIFLYSKEKKYTFNNLFEKKISERKKQLIKQGYNTKNQNGKKYLYIYNEETYKKKKEINKNLKPSNYDCIKKINSNQGNAYTDIFRVDFLNSKQLVYPTQKPIPLIERCIEICSNKGDIVCDFFGGGGTTALAASKLDRKFIVGDVSPVAYRVAIDRLNDIGASFNKLNPPLTRREWLAMNSKEFEKKICMFMGWIHNESGKPVDGWTDYTKSKPVEIKNHSNGVGVGEIKKLAGEMIKSGQDNAVFVAWQYTSGCYEYVADLEKRQKKKIELCFAHKKIGELVLNKKQKEEYESLFEKYRKKLKEIKERLQSQKKSS